MASSANPVAVIRQNLDVMAPEFRAALPAHVTVEKFTRVAMTAIQNTPALVNADRKSLFGAVVRLAQDGLLPDGREAALVMFGDKVQAMPMIAGILKKIRQSGAVAKVSAQVVYANDEFVWTLGFDEDVQHKPTALDQPRGEPIGAYATAVLTDGSQLLEVMSKEEIEKVRAVSRAKGNGPWVTWWGEMARKTVMRRLSKRLPMSTDVEDFMDKDATMPTVAELRAPETAIQSEPVSRLDALENKVLDSQEHNPETGEIIEGGRTDEQHGDQSDGTDPQTGVTITEHEAIAQQIIDAAGKCEMLIDLRKLRDASEGRMEDLPGELSALVYGAFDGAEQRLRGRV